MGNRTTAVYDADNRVKSLIDPVGNRTTWTYDAAGQVITESDPLNANRTYAYDAAGRLTSATDRLGRRIDYAYDAANRNTTVKWYANGGGLTQTQTFTYDAANNLTAAIDPDGTYTLAYDALNRVSHVDEPFSLSLTFGYDAAGNRTSVVDSLGGVTTAMFDARNLQTSEELGGTGLTRIQAIRAYDADGRLTTEGRQKWNGSAWQTVGTTTYDFDAAGRETHIKTVDGSNGVLANYTYTYDAANRLSAKVESGVTTSYAYDTSGQLTQDANISFTYDGNGNRTMTGYATGAGNRTTNDGTWTYTYDAEGNVAKKSKGSMSDTWNYSYDNNNQLVTVTYSATDGGSVTQRVTYVYDAFGNRIERDGWDGSTSTVERYGLDGWDPAKLANRVGNENFESWADLDSNNALTMRRIRTPVEALPGLHREAVCDLASWHLARLAELNGTADRVVDKLPDNYLHLGLIATLFPKARVIHCRRNLRDVAVSCWMTNFRHIRWAADLGHIAARFADYRRVTDYWRRVFDALETLETPRP